MEINASLSLLMNIGPGEMLPWVISHADDEDLNCRFWSALSEYVRSNTSRAEKEGFESVLVWARISQEVVRAEMKRCGSSFRVESEIMWLRAWLIRTYGIGNGDELLSPKPLMDWFRSVSVCSIGEIHEKVKEWMKLPAEEILRLRQMKTAIKILQFACSGPNMAGSELMRTIEPWLPFVAEMP